MPLALVISLLVLGTFAFGLIAPNAMQGAMQPLPQVRFATRFQPGPRSCSSIPEPVRRRSRSSSGWETPRKEGLQRWCSERPISSASPRSAVRFNMLIRPVFNWWDLPASTMHCGFAYLISCRRRTETSCRMSYGLRCSVPAGGRESSSSGILNPGALYPSWSIASGSTIHVPESR